MARTVSREQQCTMDLNQPQMNFSFPSLCIRKLSVLDARLPSLKNSKMGQLQMRTEHTKSEQCLSRRATSHMAQHQRLKRSGCGSRRKFLWGGMFLIVAFPHGGRKVCNVHCGRRKRGRATRRNSTAVSQRLWARSWTRLASAIWLEDSGVISMKRAVDRQTASRLAWSGCVLGIAEPKAISCRAHCSV